MTRSDRTRPDFLWAKSELLDRLLVSQDGVDVGVVDDLELTDEEVPRVTALLSGPGALGPRIDGLAGQWWASAGRRIGSVSTPDPVSIPIELIKELGRSGIGLSLTADRAPTTTFRDWVLDHLVRRIPGHQ